LKNNKIIYSKTAAMFAARCPHCHTGDVFKYNVLSMKFAVMHEHCPVCGQKYEIEPGFFWGSMYISYFTTILIGLAVGFLDFAIVKDPPVWQVITCLCIALAVLSPFSFRFSRLVMLYLFASIRFDPEAGRR
jgi:uncharacterized protein (DUF983 family)